MITTQKTTIVKARLSEFINRVQYNQERVIISRRGKPVAVLVNLQDFHQLKSLEEEESTRNGESSHPIMQAFGGWKDSPDIDELVAEIYAERRAAIPRQVDL